MKLLFEERSSILFRNEEVMKAIRNVIQWRNIMTRKRPIVMINENK